MTSNVETYLRGALEEAEDEIDALSIDLADIEHVITHGETLPASFVDRLLDNPDEPLRIWREYRGLGLRELARKAGISAALLSEIENGSKVGSVRTLAALAQVLKIDIDDLIPRQPGGEREERHGRE